MAYELTEQKKVGLGLIGFGLFFTFLGVILFFDRGLLALGNGSASFLLGLFFIFVRWPIIGILLEICGCFVLFGGFWPSIKGFLYQIPVLGWILPYPIMILESLWRGSR
ncbi:vesicle transport protein GOT1 isoform X2 [Cucurbita moschata]|uniref:Vesicle transport protein GOT1 isoform X2 n=1 Tax=Cucurbita moschata TaxID=3662 RepID=A0A6J1ETK2_CUCMO|nr:vesicle transport protein GOT1 isoform X2 [Cucurbita moschata]